MSLMKALQTTLDQTIHRKQVLNIFQIQIESNESKLHGIIFEIFHLFQTA
jgi:trehalose/maltose hydrolase-like predicted phosphorylase